MSKTILFFSRGRGHGHAIPDLAIARTLRQMDPEIEIRFVSYATGATTLEKSEFELIKLDLPEMNPFLRTLFICDDLIRRHRPALVVSHEEFSAIPVARNLGVRSVFVSAWLPAVGTLHAEALSDADAIVVLEEPGLFSVPQQGRVRTWYTGPILRKMRWTARDREELRRQLGWSKELFAIVVVPGGEATEENSPIAETVVGAFRQLEHPEKKLLWLSSKDFATIGAKYASTPEIEALQFVDPIERILAAADLVISKGTRGITHDAAAVGVPSLSLSWRRNPIDDMIVPRIRSNVALYAEAVNAAVLKFHIEKIIHLERQNERRQPAQSAAAETTARLLRQQLAEAMAAAGAAQPGEVETLA